MRSTLFSLVSSLFKKGNQDIWKRFAIKNNGIYSFVYNSRVSIPYKGFEISFDAHTHYAAVGSSSYETDFTRVSVGLKSLDELKFKVIPQGFVDSIAVWFGAQDIVVGNSIFDKKFLLKGNDTFKIQSLFSDNVVQEILMKHKHIYLSLDGEGNFDEIVPEGTVLLYAFSQDKLKNHNQLNELLLLIQALLDSLVKFRSVESIA